MASNYGIYAARKRAKKKEESFEALAKKEIKPKKTTKSAKRPPYIEVDPMNNKKIERYDYLDFNSKSITDISNELVERTKSSKAQILVLPTGFGKSAIITSAMGQMSRPTAISAPKIVINQLGWQNTIAQYNHQFGENPIDLYTATTPDKLANILGHPKSMVEFYKHMKGGTLVLDEVHMFKTPTSKRAKQLHKLPDNVFRLGLSATPLTNDMINDGISYLIMNGNYSSKTQAYRELGLDNLVGEYNQLLVYEKDGTINKNMWPLYDRFMKELSEVLYVPNVSLKDIEMPNLTNHIVQMSNEKLTEDVHSLNAAYKQRMFDSIGDFILELLERINVDKTRIENLMKIVQDKNTVCPLIFYFHNFSRDRIIEEFNKNGIKYQMVNGQNDIEDLDFKSELPILMQFQSANAGAEFKQSNTSIYFENQYSYNLQVQSRGRNVRRGMKHDVNHYYFLSDVEFEREIFNRVQNKEELNDSALETIMTSILK